MPHRTITFDSHTSLAGAGNFIHHLKHSGTAATVMCFQAVPRRPQPSVAQHCCLKTQNEKRLRSRKGVIGFRETTMTVRKILDNKGHQILSVEPEAKLSVAVKILAERKIGAVLVMQAGRMEGILSERDVVRVLGERGASVLDEPVSAVMTRKVISCKQSDTVSAIMEMMTHGKFRHLPVVEGERVVGLISIGDIVKSRVQEYEREQEALREYIKTA
jgi:CBS domain-containing protein